MPLPSTRSHSTQTFTTPRDAMSTFAIMKRKDEARTEQKNVGGEILRLDRYLTKETMLEIHDVLAESIQAGQPYQTRPNPLPADPRCCHLPKA